VAADPARRRARAASATLHRLADEILQACRADPNREAPLVRALLAATDPATGRALSDQEIRDELIVFMLAGHDTTATTLTYAMWALGHHRDMQQRVRAEVAGIGERELTPEDVTRLGYTIQVLHEALRLCPPGAAIGRTAMQDIEVDGYRVEAGSMMAVGIFALHRDPTLWDHPLVFDPDRFSPETPRAVTAGNTCRSAPGPARVSATTSPCSRPPLHSPPSSDVSKSSPSVTISR
jgi:cytochrome P450